MELTKTKLSIDRYAGEERMQLMPQGEVILPNEGIKSIVTARAQPYIVGGGTAGGKLSFEGSIDMVLICLTGDGRLISVPHSLYISENINTDKTGGDSVPQFSCSVSGTEYTLAGDRIRYKLLCEVSCRIFDTYTLTAVTGLEGAENVAEQTIDIDTLLGKRNVEIKLKDSASVGRELPNIETAIDMTVSGTGLATACVTDGLAVKGGLKQNFMYTGAQEGEALESFCFDTEIDGTAEVMGAAEDMLCCPDVGIADTTYSIRCDDDGEARIIESECTLSIWPNVFAPLTLRVPEDAYCLERELDISRCDVTGFKAVCVNKSNCPIRRALETTGEDMLRVYDVCARVTVDDTRVMQDKTAVSGAVDVDVLYVTGSDTSPVCAFKGSIPFEQVLETRGSTEDMQAIVMAGVRHIGFNMLSQREIELRGMIGIDCAIIDERHFSLITDITEGPKDAHIGDDIPSVIVYTVQHGDTLWKLGKRFHTPAQSIARTNRLDDPDRINVGDRLIIVKGY